MSLLDVMSAEREAAVYKTQAAALDKASLMSVRNSLERNCRDEERTRPSRDSPEDIVGKLRCLETPNILPTQLLRKIDDFMSSSENVEYAVNRRATGLEEMLCTAFGTLSEGGSNEKYMRASKILAAMLSRFKYRHNDALRQQSDRMLLSCIHPREKSDGDALLSRVDDFLNYLEAA